MRRLLYLDVLNKEIDSAIKRLETARQSWITTGNAKNARVLKNQIDGMRTARQIANSMSTPVMH